MTLNRLYIFSPGQVIQSAQVNAELDQLVSAMNTYAVNANFTSNNYVSDGSIVAAISTLDQNMVSALQGGSLAYYYSKNMIIKKDTDTSIMVEATTGSPAILSRSDNTFYEEQTRTLSISTIGNNQFVDVYIEEDATYQPIIDGTKRYRLVGKAAGNVPYSTTASAGQYSIGCVYIKNNKIIGTHSLENKNTAIYHYAYWGTSDEFNFALSTTLSYSTKRWYIPVFVPSILAFNVEAYCIAPSSNVGPIWNFDIYLDYTLNTEGAPTSPSSHYSQDRVPAYNSAVEGRITRVIADFDSAAEPGLYIYNLGGKVNQDAGIVDNAITVKRVYAQFTAHPAGNAFYARA